jgi:hypothetical protein
MHLFMKLVADVVNFLMLSDESQNIFQSVLAKQSCSLASASSDHVRIELVLPVWAFVCKQEAEEYSLGQTYQMEEEGGPYMHFCGFSTPNGAGDVLEK